MYRHQKAFRASFDYIVDVFRRVSVRNKSLFFLGDFNDDLTAYNSKLSRIINNNKLTQIIDKPTRATATSPTLLDLIITNNPEIILTHYVVPQVIAGHDLINVKVNISKPKRQPVIRAVRQLNHNQDSFSSMILQNSSEMHKILLTDNVNYQVKIFTENFIKSLDACAPTVTKIARRPFALWLSDDIRPAIHARIEVQKRLKGDRQNLLFQEEYKRKKKMVNILINKAKSLYYNKQLSTCSNMKNFEENCSL